MRVSRGHNIGTRGMNLGVNREGSSVDWILPFHDLATIVHQNQIRRADLAKVNAKGIYPEVIEALRVTGCDVAGDAFIKSEARK